MDATNIKTLAHCVFRFPGSVIAGLMVCRMDIFIAQSAGFAYYILYSLSITFYVAYYHVKGLSNAISAAVSITALLLIMVFIPRYACFNGGYLVVWRQCFNHNHCLFI